MYNTLFKSIIAFECASCGTVFGVSMQNNRSNCPNCLKECKSFDEGFMAYNKTINQDDQVQEIVDNDDLLSVEDVAEILGMSKRVAYEVMERSDFPLIRIRRSKRVLKSDFFEWLRRNKKL